MDGVTILNEIEVVQVVNDTFNYTAAVITLIITVLICAVIGFFIGRMDYEEIEGALMGVCIGLILSIFTGALVCANCGTVYIDGADLVKMKAKVLEREKERELYLQQEL